MVGVRIASAKTTSPNAGGQGAVYDEESREHRANASGEWGRLGAGPPGGTDARRDVGCGDALESPGELGILDGQQLSVLCHAIRIRARTLPASSEHPIP